MWKPRGSTQRNTEWNAVQRRWQDPLPLRHRLRPRRTFTPHLCDQHSRCVGVGLPCADLQRWGSFTTENVWLIILTAGDDCCYQLFLPDVQYDCRVSWRIHDVIFQFECSPKTFKMRGWLVCFDLLSHEFHGMHKANCFDMIDRLMLCDWGTTLRHRCSIVLWWDGKILITLNKLIRASKG